MTTETSTKARELVALNADIVGYSRLLADNMEQTASVLDDYQRLVKAEVTNGNGILVNFVGDNFMSVFDETTDAMRAAIAITTAVEERNRNEPEQRRVRFRMGIDRGPVVITDEGQYMGDALNIAARIQAIALPGGLSVSGDVYRALD
ncbi:MAG: adenylate/guanylate cyclase domain-containing protein, partial [Acidobacteria bacterium]|nr:adenylate/guanylate cyclase domain-containing protein [Acidobacteriota bacterium]